ncbi:hypothetical protein [Borrelia sp. P9F1]|uniref:hypothetical protein n=1 Tax=Borrelia sp. P9F1 TaxID=3058374 RepID=UPI0026490587|nr:hypothetical protein [Borrelia sp. P9F1]WKC58715.1 hypothetical protein QYZ68_05790 [Borrelia sp. P9F1]
MKKFEITMVVLFTVLMISCGNDLSPENLHNLHKELGSENHEEKVEQPVVTKTPEQHHPVVITPSVPTAKEAALEAKKDAIKKRVEGGASVFEALADEAKQNAAAAALEARKEEIKNAMKKDGASVFKALADEKKQREAAAALEARKEAAKNAVKGGASVFEAVDEAGQKKAAAAKPVASVRPKQQAQVAPAVPAVKPATAKVKQLPSLPAGQQKMMSGVFQRFVKQQPAGTSQQSGGVGSQTVVSAPVVFDVS